MVKKEKIGWEYSQNKVKSGLLSKWEKCEGHKEWEKHLERSHA